MPGRSSTAFAVASLAGVVAAGVPGVARAQVDEEGLARSDLGAAALLVLVAGWIVYLLARSWWGSGREVGRRRADVEPSLELLDDPPAVVDALRSGGQPRPAVVGLVLLDLARRGYLEIAEVASPVGRDWQFRRLERPPGDLEPYENAVSTRLFAGSGALVAASDLVRWAEGNRNQARVFLDRVRNYVANEMAERGYLRQPSRVPVLANLVAAGIVVLAGLAALFSGAVVGLVVVASGVGQASLSRGLRRRTPTSAARADEWFRIARGLQEVGDADERGESDWDHLLVYAVALGVGETFVAGVLGRDDVDAPSLGAWFRAEGGDQERLYALVRFPDRLGQVLTATVERIPATPGLRPGSLGRRPSSLPGERGSSRVGSSKATRGEE